MEVAVLGPNSPCDLCGRKAALNCIGPHCHSGLTRLTDRRVDVAELRRPVDEQSAAGVKQQNPECLWLGQSHADVCSSSSSALLS